MNHRSPRARASGALLFALAGGALGACGVRGPLDDGPYFTDGTTGGNDGAAPGPGADSGGTPGSGVDGATPLPGVDAGLPPGTRDASADARADASDAGDASLADCGTCVATSCGTQIGACIGDTACQQALTCIAQTCLSGGLNPTCFLTCAKNDTKVLGTILKIFTCVTQTCGGACGGVLTGGGIPGLPGTPAVPGASAAESTMAVDLAQQAPRRADGEAVGGDALFSAYPLLVSRATH